MSVNLRASSKLVYINEHSSYLMLLRLWMNRPVRSTSVGNPVAPTPSANCQAEPGGLHLHHWLFLDLHLHLHLHQLLLLLLQLQRWALLSLHLLPRNLMLVVGQITGLWAEDQAHPVLVPQQHHWNKNISCHLRGRKYDEGSWYDGHLTTSRIFPSNAPVAGPLIHKPVTGYDPETIPVASHPHSLFAQDPYEFYHTPILIKILQVFFISLISATHSTYHSLLYFTVQTMLGDVLHHLFAVYWL